MGTNTPAKHPNVKRVTVTAAAEVPFSFDGVPTVIGFKVQVYTDQVAVLMGFEPGSTVSIDNYWTIKAGQVYEESDINWTPDQYGLYFLSASGTIIVEVTYWG